MEQASIIIQFIQLLFQWIFLISGILGFILIPTFVKVLHEIKRLNQLYREFKQNDSDGGEKITITELIALLEESGIIFRQISRLFKSD